VSDHRRHCRDPHSRGTGDRRWWERDHRPDRVGERLASLIEGATAAFVTPLPRHKTA
jgi:hypothetical protein